MAGAGVLNLKDAPGVMEETGRGEASPAWAIMRPARRNQETLRVDHAGGTAVRLALPCGVLSDGKDMLNHSRKVVYKFLT